MNAEAYFKKKPPRFNWYRGAILMKSDPRVNVVWDESKLFTSVSIKKCKISDEAKFKCQVEDDEGAPVEFAGFMVFVKGIHIYYANH